MLIFMGAMFLVNILVAMIQWAFAVSALDSSLAKFAKRSEAFWDAKMASFDVSVSS
jgi:hypothetical protein